MKIVESLRLPDNCTSCIEIHGINLRCEALDVAKEIADNNASNTNKLVAGIVRCMRKCPGVVIQFPSDWFDEREGVNRGEVYSTTFPPAVVSGPVRAHYPNGDDAFELELASSAVRNALFSRI